MRRLITKKQVAELVNYHSVHIDRLAKAGRFPRPIKFGPSVKARVMFDADEVAAWIDAKAAERGAAQP